MHDFFSIGLLVLIGLCLFYRLETSAPGLSGYYWYEHNTVYTILNIDYIDELHYVVFCVHVMYDLFGSCVCTHGHRDILVHAYVHVSCMYI